ncbi:MAG: T9SS type A sorting domain-containing protein [Bacteroidales bacterium]|nr:T9SS type A sorting domain-containing protein [Bacteroidales bacterium]MCF8391681.1 T9SS type A sorting domain-containing protein [Bacteroidales bacterium]
MQNPAAVTDDLGEWFELYNTTDSEIDIQGWNIIDDDHTLLEEGFTFPNSLVIPSGGYVLIATNGDAGTNGGLPTPDYVYNYENLTLGNGVDGITIQCSGTLIDAVVWDDGVSFPDPSGASMLLKVANLNATDNDAGANWITVTNTYGSGDFGTPGSENIPLGIKSGAISGFTIYPNPVNEGVFRVSFSSEADRSIKIFNLLGKQVYSFENYKNESVNVSDLTSGIYFLRVEEEKNVTVQKFIIQK